MPGTVLLLAASPAGKGCLVDAASVLPVLAAVAPPVLSGTDTANVVELADPLEPQAVLTRLRAAAGAPGPLTVFLTGQLQLDRRQHLPHLALARTTPATVRYTGFPWHWFREELRLRPPGATTVFADLHADPETWQHLHTRPLDCGPTVLLHGRIAPPPRRRALAIPAYMKTLATILRSGHRPDPATLHHQVLTRVYADAGPQGDVILAPNQPIMNRSWLTPPSYSPPPPPAAAPAPPDPHAALTAAVQDGRHTEAAALAAQWEQAALREHGPGSQEALHWMEVRADLAMLAGDAGRSCEAWLAVAAARLSAGQSPEDPAVEAAVDRAHHQWGSMRDAARARELGPALADLRARVPGRREGALDHVHRRLRRLQGQLQTQP
ncbi:hypothetical protein ACFOZ0_09915 [Streptomyces yaanensis]|uniref:Uncharacterized protein n=1 Tax=Streptomyces yaanensis TaxID=1142239 RepID=A0ABV7S9C6_9ACTN|nr:hypothetical protein [Streptomyces sp. CGMCC 4.7035]WNB96670.1 hypothetical protein Q2K21_00505 [Streptomyces sp. CGMCC 4.7035]